MIPAMSTDPRFAEPTPFARLVYAHAVERRAVTRASPCRSRARCSSRARPTAARGKVLLYLLLTMAPFAIVAPGARARARPHRRRAPPARGRVGGGPGGPLRRHGDVHQRARRRRACSSTRSPSACWCWRRATRSPRARSCPRWSTDDDELVNANSRLALLSVIAATVGGLPAAGIQQLFGADWSLRVAAVVFVVAAILAFKIPKTRTREPGRRASGSSSSEEEMHQPSILLAGSAMAVLRGSVGLPRVLRRVLAQGRPVRARRRARRAARSAASSACVAAPVAAAVGAGGGDRRVVAGRCPRSFALLGALVRRRVRLRRSPRSRSAIGAAAGRLGFDSLLQRDGPDAVRGRAFARFETRFQLVWVIGGMIGIIPFAESAGALRARDRARVRGGVLRRGAARVAEAGDAHEAAARLGRPRHHAFARAGARPRATRGSASRPARPASHRTTRRSRLTSRGQGGRYWPQPLVAPCTMPKGPTGQRKQSTISMSTCSRVAIPSSTHRVRLPDHRPVDAVGDEAPRAARARR